MADNGLPRELAKYIGERQVEVGEANTADFKPTSADELQQIKANCIESYKVGEEIIATISKADLERCKKLYVLRNNGDYGMDDLRRARVLGQWCLVPSYVTLVSEMRQLKAVLA